MQQLELPASRPAEHARVRLLNTPSPRNRRLARNLDHLVAADPDVENLGQDPEILAMLQDRGFNESDIATVGIRVGDEQFALLCVRQTRWHDPSFMAGLRHIRSEAQDLGKRVVLIPESFVQRQPRFQSTKPVARAAGNRISAMSRMKILAALVVRGPTSLMDCATMVEATHADPVGCILHLVSTGVVWMDLDRRLCLDGLIHLPGDERGVELSYGVAA